MKRKLLLSGGVLLVVILIGAAYLAGRLVTKAPQVDQGAFVIQRSGELPSSEPNVAGVVTERADHSVMVGTNVTDVNMDKSGGMHAEYEGPVVEIVVNQNTTIFRNMTDVPEQHSQDQKTQDVQQTVGPGSLDEITTGTTLVSVWGNRSGDRVVARVLLYSDLLQAKLAK